MDVHALPQAKRLTCFSAVDIDFVRNCVEVCGING
jgi:hypothetical protein